MASNLAPRRKTQPEHGEQAALFEWAQRLYNVMPELKLMYAIPNAQLALSRIPEKGQRFAFLNYLNAEGIRKGFPDIGLPVARGIYHGLFIEMKFGKNKPDAEQLAWHEELRKQGYCVAVCYGWTEAAELIQGYLKGRIK